MGGSPHVLMIQHELEDVYKKCRTRPQFFSLRLAERLFGLDVMMKSTPNGIGGKAALNPTILDAIKSNYLYLNPLSPKSDSHETSPQNIHTLFSKQVTIIFKLIR